MSRGAPTSTAGRDGSLVRAALLWWLPLALLILAGVYVVYVNEGRHSLMELRQGQRGRLRLHTQRIASEIKQVMADCLVHAQLLESLHWGKGLSQRDQKEMAWAFASLLRRKEAYDQVRILDEYGREILRVEQGPEGPLVAARELLQDKSTRPYFRQGMSLERGQINVSKFDLNQEHGRIEIPHKPAIRFTTPTFDAEGNQRGVLVINYLGEAILGTLRPHGEELTHQVFMIDNLGYWLLGPSPRA